MTDMQLLGLLVVLVAVFGFALAEVPAIKNIRLRSTDSGTPSSAETSAADDSSYQPEAQLNSRAESTVHPPYLRRVK